MEENNNNNNNKIDSKCKKYIEIEVLKIFSIMWVGEYICTVSL